MGHVSHVHAVLFDYSGTLFRLEEDESWFDGMEVDEVDVDGHVQAELMRRLTAPTGRPVDMTDEQYHAWVNRDLAPHLHREAYLHVLRESGLPHHHAESLYGRVIDPSSWTPYPDTAEVLKSLHGQGVKPIAQQLALSANTVRTHLHNIFTKTRTHRQAELVGLLLTTTPRRHSGRRR